MWTVVLSEEEYNLLMHICDSEESYRPAKADEILFSQLVESLNGALKTEETK